MDEQNTPQYNGDMGFQGFSTEQIMVSQAFSWIINIATTLRAHKENGNDEDELRDQFEEYFLKPYNELHEEIKKQNASSNDTIDESPLTDRAKVRLAHKIFDVCFQLAESPETQILLNSVMMKRNPDTQEEIEEETHEVIQQAAHEVFKDSQWREMFNQTVDATDKALELAKEHDINIVAVNGTGKNGRVTYWDVNRYIKKQPEDKD